RTPCSAPPAWAPWPRAGPRSASAADASQGQLGGSDHHRYRPENRAAPTGRRPSDPRRPALAGNVRPATLRGAGRGRPRVGTDARPPAERVTTEMEIAKVYRPGGVTPQTLA